MKKNIILSFIGLSAYYIAFYNMFLPSQSYIVSFYLLSVLSLAGIFIFKKKSLSIYSIITMIIYLFSFPCSHILEVFLHINHFTSQIAIILFLFIIFIISLIVLVFYFLKQLYISAINQHKYIQQIENEIQENYIHLLRHDYNEKLYQIINSINSNNKEKALNDLKELTQQSYRSEAFTISNSSFLNHLFQSQYFKYKKENISFQYYLCRIDQQFWNKHYTMTLYKLLELSRIQNNEIIVYLQTKEKYFECKIISKYPINYKQLKNKKIIIEEKKLKDHYVYILKMSFNK